MKKKFAAVIVSAISTASVSTFGALTAFAEDGGGSGQSAATGSLLSLIIPLVLMFAVIYFMSIKPQKKQEEEIKAMQDSLKIGDEVVTTGGIIGMVIRIADDNVVIETGGDRTRIRVKRVSIAENVSAAERIRAEKAKAAKKSPMAAAGISDKESKPKKEKKSAEKE